MIAQYRVIRVLGRGGFAWVYEVRDTTDDRPAALKLLDAPPSEEDAPEFHERFLREARTIGKLRHTNIVEVRGFGVVPDTGRPYMAMELLRGHDLEAELAQSGPLEPRRARHLFSGALDALGMAHAAGVVHKDLKPTNLFIAEPGTPSERMVLVDFGIAWAETDSRLTRAGTFTGTPAYAAPEYIRANLVTPALDVYQMGLVLSEALSGTPCVTDTAPVQVILAHLNGNIGIPASLDETDLGPIVRKATSLDPADRYASGTEFRQALEHATFSGTAIPGPAVDEFAASPTRAFHVLPVSLKKRQTVDMTKLFQLPTQAAPVPVMEVEQRATRPADHTVATHTVGQPRSRKRILLLGVVLALAMFGAAALLFMTNRQSAPALPPSPLTPVAVASSSEDAGHRAEPDGAVSDRADTGPATVGGSPAPADVGSSTPDVGPAAVDAGGPSDAGRTLGPGVWVSPFEGARPAPPPDDGIRPVRFGTTTYAERVAQRAVQRRDWTRAIAACKRHGETSNACAWTLARAHRERGDLVSSCYWLAVAGFTTSDCK